MMQPNELKEILKKIEGLKNLDGKLKACGLVKKSENYPTPQEIQEKVENFNPEQGWLCFQSKVEYFRKGKTMPYSGILLYGEVINAQGQSLHIREDGQGGWILTSFEETEDNNYLVEDTEFLGEKELAPKKLRYRVYWKYDERHGYRQVAARFNGFA